MALAALALAGGASLTGLFDRSELQALDARFALRGSSPAPDVAIVAIDDATFSELGVQWPFPRSLHARLIDRLREAGVRQIAYDVQFTEPTKPREDLALYDAAGRAGHVVLSTTEVDSRGRTNVLGGDENLRVIGARAASTNLPADVGGVTRRLPAEVEGLMTFAVAAVRAADPSRSTRFPAPRDDTLIDFHGPPGTIDTFSFSDVLRGRVPAGALRDRIVVVGASAPSLQDVHATSTSGDELMAGPEIQANAISTVLRDAPLRDAPIWLGPLMMLVLVLVPTLLALRRSALGAAALVVGAALAWLIACQLAFGAGLVLPAVYPLAALLLAAIGTLALRLLLEARERRRTRSIFERFAPAEVVDQLLERGDGSVRLEGERLEATVMFCDLRGFSAFAESTPADRVIEVLNRYLSEMSDAILNHGGTLVSYMGDGIMAVFGAPLARDDHADAAVAAAQEMLGARLESVNRWLAEGGIDTPFRMGIGVHSGVVMSGTVGSERRLEYAAIGDTTNVAARLEAMTKEAGSGLLVSESTVSALAPGYAGLEEVGELSIRGRQSTLRAWTLAAEEPREPPAREAECARTH